MSKFQGKGARFGGAGAFSSPARGFGGFSSQSTSSGLSYLVEPPDLSSISDANVVVSFKNLLKKDATTKTKALEELVAYVQAHPFEQEGGTEEAILEAWVQVYPRTSIDNARRVRELSHTLQFELVKSARKRMEKRIPRIVGTWLAGLYDKDRGVSRAADQGLSSFLNSPDKVVMFWTKCQSQILTYATEAIQETQETLSDERSTTPDDAEAKYFRVVGASLSLVLGLLQKVDNADVEKERESYDAFFGEEKVWKSIIVGDATAKKAACQLLWVCLEKREAAISAQTSRLKKIFITEGLKSSQIGSAIEYVRVLTRLTQKFPEIWSSSSDKKTPVSRLGGFLERGSQASSVKYWEYLEQLLVAVPKEHITSETATNILKSLRVGITGREEPRMHAPTAWTSYVRITRHFISTLPADETRAQFVRENLFPLTSHYLNPTPETSAWDIGGNGKIPVLVEAFQTSADRHHEDTIQATADEWTRLAEEFCARIASSLPEVSKDYQKSQDAIAEQSTRWFTLVGQIHSKTTASHQKLPPIVETPSIAVIARAIQLLSSRNVKPFGAAALLASVGKHAPHLWEDPAAVADFWDFLFETGKNRMQLVLDSRSLTYLARCVADLGAVTGQQDAFKEVWTVWIEALLGLKNHEQTRGAVRSLVSHDAAAPLATSLPGLQEYLVSQAEQYLGGDDDALPILEAAATHNTLTDDSAKAVIEGALETLRQDSAKSARVLAVVGIIVTSKPQVVSQDETHMALVTALLGLTELSDTDISSRAVSLRALIDNGVDGKAAGVSIIQKNLEEAGAQSLSIETLYQQALQAVESDGVGVTDLFPNTNLWKEQLQSFLQQDVNPSLSITNNLEGAVFLVQASDLESGRLPRLRRDRDGCVAPLRMALYAGKLLSSNLDLESLPQDFKVEVLFLLSITVQLATDQMTLGDENKLWSSLGTSDSLESAAKFVSTSRSIILDFVEAAFGWRDGTDDGSTPLIETLIAVMIQQSTALTPMGLYSARALSELVEGLNDKHGIPLDSEAKLAKYDTLKATPSTVLAAVALLRGYGEMLESSKLTNTLCNRLVSDIAGLSVSSNKTLATLVLFNACAQVYELGEIPVPNNRLVFAIRQVTSWLEDPVALTPQLSAEVCRALQRLLPCIKEVYGPHWERTIDFCTNLWVKASEDELDAVLPYIHASIKLMNTLETISEPNDDLDDALKEAAETTALSLLELLKLPREKNTQPLEITDALICRRVGKLSLRHVSDLSELYGLMASDSRDIQSAAFSLLHRALPAAQAKLSIDVLLDKTEARLPDELLSLLLDAPTLEKYPDEVLAKFPTPIRSYLLTWCLIFDAYSTASLKVRTDYTEHLKTENYVGPLMDFMFDVLGHSASHPLNLEREGLTTDHIQSYDLRNADSEPEERNLHWLLIHVFYLTLKYTPGLFKAWFMDCRSKQTTNAVKDWLMKHFTPLIVSELLDEVAQWAKDQEEPADDEKELVVKVSHAAKEITAGYEVDESLASISIRVPPGYPIDIVTVAGLNRVAVNERKWNSWLMTTQGVITFSNGSIIDGLTTFRRNIVGALKGQSECAICYSIISTDKKMPDKKCSTCKNLFHRTCLYKWFQSSNQNTCPLCRNPIDYIGADTKSRRAAVA
ncbi:hypothetical protein B0T11DRAFT_121007 [Plectosphaerella cucumerina]|uniref:E3 ubiquitin-protein ligase listerin n=1 Tax=Plectosphaerella cucumerina TaxID=40658 RepID=A0A8K0T8I2_9PEZI|nr:hypothetical protein B0T11DRAFT_121007 [Plectosphaerella cucumerina]